MRVLVFIFFYGLFLLSFGGLLTLGNSVPPRAGNPLAVSAAKIQHVTAPYMWKVGLALVVVRGIGLIVKRL